MSISYSPLSVSILYKASLQIVLRVIGYCEYSNRNIESLLQNKISWI